MIEAEQTERDGATVRNDRLIAVATKSLTHRDLKSLEQLTKLGPRSGEDTQGGDVENVKDRKVNSGDTEGRNVTSGEVKSRTKGGAVENNNAQSGDVESADTNHVDFRAGDIVLEEIEHFFISYNTFKGKQFKPLGRFGPDRARRLIQEGIDRCRGK